MYETSIVAQNEFYETYKVGNFTFIPNGGMIDTCHRYGNISDMFNLTDYYNYYQDLANISYGIQTKYANMSDLTTYKNLISYNSMTTSSDFIGQYNGVALPWDSAGFQINYYLYPLPSYSPYESRKFLVNFSSGFFAAIY